MNGLLAAVLAGAAVAAGSLTVVRPPGRIGPQVDPYIQRHRQALGETADPSLLFEPPGEVGVWRPLIRVLARRLSGLIDTGGSDVLAERIHHAGWDMTPEQYRLGQLASTFKGAGAVTLAALLLAPSAASVLLAAVLGAVAGASHWRARIDKAITLRRAQIRAELATIAELLAMRISAGVAPMVAIADLAARARGPVPSDLSDALGQVQDGTPGPAAFEQLAARTPEPAAERLYRLLARAEHGTGSALTQSLTAAARSLRTQQREDLERDAVRRSFAMLLPTVLLMGPVLLLFLAAPLPTLIFGG